VIPPASTHTIVTDPAAFALDEAGGMDAFYREHGFAILRGVLDADTLAALEAECVDALRRLVAGEFDARYGTTALIEGDAGEKATRFANYFIHITDLSPTADAVIHGEEVTGAVRRWLGPRCARRRHVRGSWYAGAEPVNFGPDDFVKNAAR
jgi:hypothetical protein